MRLGPTRALLWPETDVEGVQPWQPGPLETTDTWTGLQAWKKHRVYHINTMLNTLTASETMLNLRFNLSKKSSLGDF